MYDKIKDRADISVTTLLITAAGHLTDFLYNELLQESTTEKRQVISSESVHNLAKTLLSAAQLYLLKNKQVEQNAVAVTYAKSQLHIALLRLALFKAIPRDNQGVSAFDLQSSIIRPLEETETLIRQLTVECLSGKEYREDGKGVLDEKLAGLINQLEEFDNNTVLTSSALDLTDVYLCRVAQSVAALHNVAANTVFLAMWSLQEASIAEFEIDWIGRVLLSLSLRNYVELNPSHKMYYYRYLAFILPHTDRNMTVTSLPSSLRDSAQEEAAEKLFATALSAVNSCYKSSLNELKKWFGQDTVTVARAGLLLADITSTIYRHVRSLSDVDSEELASVKKICEGSLSVFGKRQVSSGVYEEPLRGAVGLLHCLLAELTMAVNETLVATAGYLYNTGFKVLDNLADDDCRVLYTSRAAAYGVLSALALKKDDFFREYVTVLLENSRAEWLVARDLIAELLMEVARTNYLAASHQRDLLINAIKSSLVHLQLIFKFGQYFDAFAHYKDAVSIFKEVLYGYADMSSMIYAKLPCPEWVEAAETSMQNRKPISIRFAEVICCLGESLYEDARERYVESPSYSEEVVDTVFHQVELAILRGCSIYQSELQPVDASPIVYMLLKRLIKLQIRQKSYEGAKESFENILRLFLDSHFSTIDQVAQCYEDYADMLMEKKDFFQAALMYQMAVDNYRDRGDLLPSGDPRPTNQLEEHTDAAQELDPEQQRLQGKIAVNLVGKAHALFAQEDFENAQECAEIARELLLEQFGEDCREIVLFKCCNILGLIHYHYEERQEAKEMFDQAERILRENQLDESLDRAKLCRNQGVLLDSMKQPEQARDVLEQGLAILLRKHSSEFDQVSQRL